MLLYTVWRRKTIESNNRTESLINQTLSVKQNSTVNVNLLISSRISCQSNTVRTEFAHWIE